MCSMADSNTAYAELSRSSVERDVISNGGADSTTSSTATASSSGCPPLAVDGSRVRSRALIERYLTPQKK